jgi:hypothetical protein
MAHSSNEYQREYMRKYRKTHKHPSKIERILMKAIQIKLAFDLSNEECLKRAMEEIKT